MFLLFTSAEVFGVEAFPAEAGLGLSAAAGLFLLGLALNLTPCVYPMLTVTLAVFGTGKEKSRFKIITRAVGYVLGIATMYSILGVAAAFTGGLFGGIMQSGTVLAGIGVLFILLSLSMFGLWEIQPPSRILSKFSGRGGAGYAGVYLSGLMVGIFAAPCIGPPVIALMTAVGQRGDPVFGFTSFFILSLGLGFPYLILGTFSSLIPRLPKSGTWMVWVRKALGVILLAVGFFYFSLLIGGNIVFILIPAVLAAGGVYLGVIAKGGINKRVFIYIKYLTGALFIAAAFFLFRAGRAPAAKWGEYDTEIDTPSVIYFSADWCVPCLEMDIRTFTDPRVIEALENLNLMKVDLTRYDSPRSRQLRQKYDIAGVPTIIFTDEEGEEISPARKVGFVSSEELIDTAGRVDRYLRTGIYEDADEKETEKEPSTAELVSDTEWIRPGSSFYIGMLFEMKEGWHIYWINPGDSGVEPRIKWDIPEGFPAGDIRWPRPKRFEEGPFYTFGHDEYLLLSRKITVPENIETGKEVRFRAEASWLACMDICISQQGESELVMEVRDETPVKDERRKELFKETEESLPVKDHRWDFGFRKEDKSIVLYVTPPEGIGEDIVKSSEFFPLEPGLVRTDPVRWVRENSRYFNKMRLEDPAAEIDIFKGVLVMPDEAEGMVEALAVEAEREE